MTLLPNDLTKLLVIVIIKILSELNLKKKCKLSLQPLLIHVFHGAIGCGQASVAVPLAPVQVPSQWPLAPSVIIIIKIIYYIYERFLHTTSIMKYVFIKSNN